MLDSSGLLYYYSEKAERVGQQPEQSTVNLVTAAVKLGLVDEQGRDVGGGKEPNTSEKAFRIVSPEREYALQAEDAGEAMAWVKVLQSVISCLLSGAYEAEDVEGYMRDLGFGQGAGGAQKGMSPIKRPTHSRDASQDVGKALAVMDLAGGEPATRDGCEFVCTDCGSCPADWASINLVARLCIECSGIHRKLGVHVSKVRSQSLDTKVWDEAMLNLFARFEGGVVNRVWEARVEEAGQKPTSGSSVEDKEAFITLKYVEKAFISPEASAKRHDQELVSLELWSAIERGELVGVYEALVVLEGRPASPRREAKALAASAGCTGSDLNGEDAPLLPTHVHLAAKHGDCDILLLLLLSGKFDMDEVDTSGRSAFTYALWFDRVEAAKMLLKQGAKQVADFDGRSPYEVMRSRREQSLQCASDPELLELLA